MKKIIFVADFFEDQIVGGAEKNDANLINYFKNKNLLEQKINSQNITTEFLESKKDYCVFIVSNFSLLSVESKRYLADYCKYIIYEHDYKFCKTRNPIFYKDFLVPIEYLTNINFYKNAIRVVTLSKLHYDIFQRNLKGIILENIKCSLFSEESLDFLSSLIHKEKKEEYGIIDYKNSLKNTNLCIDYAKKNNLNFSLFSDNDYYCFLNKMADYKKLILMPGHPEPTPRTAVEAKILGIKIVANKNLIGVSHEEWWSLEKEDLVKEIKKINQEAYEKFMVWINEI